MTPTLTVLDPPAPAVDPAAVDPAAALDWLNSKTGKLATPTGTILSLIVHFRVPPGTSLLEAISRAIAEEAREKPYRPST